MAAIGDVARIVMPSMPKGMGEPGDYLHDAWQMWLRARNSVTDRNRKEPGSCEAREVMGVPGWMWEGSMNSIRHLLWPGSPYTAISSDQADIDAASSRYRELHGMLTQKTGNAICVKRGSGTSLWWIRDEFSGDRLTEARWAEFRTAAGGTPNQRREPAAEPAASLPADPVPGTPAVVLTCRYALATGCGLTYMARSSLNAHEERSLTHSGHAIVLTDCPVCGTRLTSPLGRAAHLSDAHGAGAGSQERLDLDARQTKELWDAREARQATLKPAGDGQDAEQAALESPEPDSAEPASHASADVAHEDERIGWLRSLIADYDALKTRVAEQGEELDRLAMIREILGT